MNIRLLRNFITILFLGIASGTPFALLLSSLKVLLIDLKFDIQTVGFFALLGLPYNLKILIAPFVDSCSIPFLTAKIGQRKSWIAITQLGLILLITTLGLVCDQPLLLPIILTGLMIAIFSAAQDIAIDGYRIELLKQEDQAIGSGCYIYGFRIGMMISGALALFLAQKYSWKLSCFAICVCVAICLFSLFFSVETRPNWKARNLEFRSWFKEFVIAPILDFSGRKSYLLILAFIILFKLGDAFAGSITLPFLLDIGFDKVEIAKIVKTFGLFATLLGVFVGGILVKRFGVINSLWFSGSMQMLSNLGFVYLAKMGYDPKLLYIVIFLENISGGMGDVVFVAYLSGLCNKEFSATQYSILSSVASLSRTVISSFSGVVVQKFGWYNFYVSSIFLSIPSLLFLFLLKKYSVNFKNPIHKN